MDMEYLFGRMEENTKEHISVKTNIEFDIFICFYIISIFLKRFDIRNSRMNKIFKNNEIRKLNEDQNRGGKFWINLN